MTVISNTIASSMYAAYQNESAVLVGARAATDKIIQQALDCMLIACTIPKVEFLKGNSVKNLFRAEVKALFDGFTTAEHGGMPTTTADQYRSSFWIAFENGVPFQRDLVNQKSDAKKAVNAQPRREVADGADTGTTPSLSKTVSVTRENLLKALETAISMARTLGLTGFAQDMTELANTALDAKIGKAIIPGKARTGKSK